MNNLFRYNSIEFKLPIEYNPIFFRNKMPNPWTFLKKMTREEVVRLVILLGNAYEGKPFSHVLYLMSDGNWWKQYVELRIFDYMGRHTTSNKHYFVCFSQTLLEILRNKFSMSPTSSSMYKQERNSFEFDLVKLVALINEQTMGFHIKHKNHIEEFMMTGIGYNKDIQLYDYTNQFKSQLNFAITFFSFLTSREEYQDLYQGFLGYYGISNWREYVCTILSLAIMGREKNGILDLTSLKDPDHLINVDVLEKISIPLWADPIPYKSRNEYDREGNSDYKVFRDKPIIKMSNHEYAICHVGFVLDRLYSSLFFDFKKIEEKLNSKQSVVSNLFTSEFIEKHVFCGLMEQCAINSSYSKYSEHDCESQYKAPNGELGAPDYLVQQKNGTSAIIFECKDIKINAWVKEQRDYALLEEELKNKIQLTTWELDYENKYHRTKKKPKIKGVGQLASHCSCIKRGKFKWGNSIHQNAKLYSVLVIADNRLLIDGLAPIVSEWYVESLRNEDCPIDENVRPLIIMSPLCLLKHSERFAKDGFEKYFEEYYKHIEISIVSRVDAINRDISFDSYMDIYPYNISDKFELLKNELLKGRKVADE